MKSRDRALKDKKPEYKFLKGVVQRMVRSSKRKFIRSRLNDDKNIKQWWQLVKSLTQKQNTPSSSTITVIDNKRLSNSELCSELNAYFKSVGGQLLESSPYTATGPEAEATFLDHVSIGEIKLMLEQIDTSKSCNSKDFPSWLSVEGREDLCIPLHHIINTMLTTGEYPDLWKEAEVRPLPKVTTPTCYKDFRPISLLYNLGKLAENVIIKKMRPTLETVIKKDQFAYQRKIGTVDALLQLVDDITSALDKSDVKYVQLASLDFSKAFDRLQPNIVLEKMKLCEFSSNIT